MKANYLKEAYLQGIKDAKQYLRALGLYGENSDYTNYWSKNKYLIGSNDAKFWKNGFEIGLK